VCGEEVIIAGWFFDHSKEYGGRFCDVADKDG